MKKRTIFSVAAIGIAAIFYGQQNGNDRLYPNLTEFSDAQAPGFAKGKFLNAAKGQENVESKLLKSEKDNHGFEHFRYQQTLNGIPVEGAFFVQHVKNGKLMSQNGTVVKDFTSESKNSRT